MNKINLKSKYKNIVFNYYLNDYQRYNKTILCRTYSSQSNDSIKKQHLDNLNDLFKQFEKSVFRKDVLKNELYRKWDTNLHLNRIQSTNKLLESLRNNDKYKSATEYLLSKYHELYNKELSYVFKIYKNISKPIHLRDESTKKLLDLLGGQVIQRASTFDLSDNYDITLGLESDTTAKLLEILEKHIGSSIKFGYLSTQQNVTYSANFEHLEDIVIELDSTHNIWKISQLLRFYKLKSETKRESMYEIIKMIQTDQDKMAPVYLINCLGLVSSNINNLFPASKDTYTIGDLVIKNKNHVIEHAENLISSKFLYHLMNDLVQTDLNEFKRLFEVLFKNMRKKLLKDANDPIEFFKYFGIIDDLIRCESNIVKTSSGGNVMNKIKTQNKNRQQATSTINSKLIPTTDASLIQEYLDKELKQVIINKYDEMSEKCDLFSFKQLCSVYPTILQIHPNKEKATKIIYNRVLKACDEPFRYNPLKYVNLLTKNESKENEIKLCDKLMEYLPGGFDSMNAKEKDALLSYLMRNEETLSKYYSFIIGKMKMLLKSKEDYVDLFTSLNSFNVHLPKLIEKDQTSIIELSKIMFDTSIEICVDANIESLSKMDFIKYSSFLETTQMILRFVKKYLNKPNSSTSLLQIFQSSNMINYGNLVNMLSENKIGLDMYRHIVNTHLLNQFMVLSNRYSLKCLNDALYIIISHLDYYLNKSVDESDKNYSSTKETRLLAFHLLQLYVHFDITNSKYFIKNKSNLESLMSNFYSSVILKDTNENRKIKNTFEYICFLTSLNLSDVDAFKYFISNQSFIEKMMGANRDLQLRQIKQTLSARHPVLNYEYKPSKIYFNNFDKKVLNELKKNFETILLNKGILAQYIKYPFGLLSNFELTINDVSLFNSQDSDTGPSTVKMPVYLMSKSMCYDDSYKPKRMYSIELDNLKALGYPVLELPIEEYNSKKDKIEYLSLKIEESLNN